MTGKASLGPKKIYLRESGKDFNSNVGLDVCVTKEGELEESEERELISSTYHFQSNHEHMSHHKYTYLAN